MIKWCLFALVLSCNPQGGEPSHPSRQCSERVTGDPYTLAEKTCQEHHTYCVADDRVFNQRATCGLMVTWSPTACAQDLNLCGFVFYHEEGHARKMDEDEADCFAAREAILLGHPEYVDAAVCAVDLEGSSMTPERAARIMKCADTPLSGG